MTSQMATEALQPTTAPRKVSLNGIRLLLTLGTLCLLYYHLGTLALTESSEARYGSIARTMVDTGDWFTPVLNGLPHYSKPPLAYWASALGMKIWGITEFGARFFLPLAGVATILGCFEIGLLLGSLRLALCSSLALMTSLMFLVLFRGLTADPWLAAWETWMVWALLAHDRQPGARHSTLFWLFASLGMITKGFPALLPLLGLLPVLVARDTAGKWKSLLMNRIGWVLFLVVGLGWYLAVAIANPSLFRYFLVQETVNRMTSSVHERAKPWHFFFWLVPLSIFPWSAFFLAGLSKLFTLDDPRRSETRALLPWWIGVPFLILTLSQSKMATYALPLLVPVALVVGDFLSRIIHPAADEPFSFKLETAFTLILFGMISLGLVFFAMADFLPDLKVARVAIFIALHLLFIMAFGYSFMYLGLAKGVIMVLAVAMPGFVFFAMPALQGHEEIMTGRHLPTYRLLLRETARLASQSQVLCVEDLLFGIPFYSGRSFPTWNVKREPSFHQNLQDTYDLYGDQALQTVAASDSWLYLIREKDLRAVEQITQRKLEMKARQGFWGLYALNRSRIQTESLPETASGPIALLTPPLSAASGSSLTGSSTQPVATSAKPLTASTSVVPPGGATPAAKTATATGTAKPAVSASGSIPLPSTPPKAPNGSGSSPASNASAGKVLFQKPVPVLPASATIDTLLSPAAAPKPAAKPTAKPAPKPAPPAKPATGSSTKPNTPAPASTKKP